MVQVMLKMIHLNEWNGTDYVGGLMITEKVNAWNSKCCLYLGELEPMAPQLCVTTSDNYNGTSWSTDVNIRVALNILLELGHKMLVYLLVDIHQITRLLKQHMNGMGFFYQTRLES